MFKGRGEDFVTRELTRRGHTVVQQAPVWRNDRVGQYFIDLTVGQVAVELYTYWRAPWEHEDLILRSQNLIMSRWRVMFVWMQEKTEPTDSLIDSILQFVIDADAGTQHTYRATDHTGALLRVGWLSSSDELITDEPDAKPEPLIDQWNPNPPVPPSVAHPDRRGRLPNVIDKPTTREQFDLHNEHRRLWWLYEQAFDEWEKERQRRKPPWMVLWPAIRARTPLPVPESDNPPSADVPASPGDQQ